MRRRSADLVQVSAKNALIMANITWNEHSGTHLQHCDRLPGNLHNKRFAGGRELLALHDFAERMKSRHSNALPSFTGSWGQRRVDGGDEYTQAFHWKHGLHRTAAL